MSIQRSLISKVIYLFLVNKKSKVLKLVSIEIKLPLLNDRDREYFTSAKSICVSGKYLILLEHYVHYSLNLS